MSQSKTHSKKFSGEESSGSVAPGIDSRFRLVILAGKRTKQLLQGAEARVESDQKRRKGTSIALEEMKRGLVVFATTDES